uniref:Uncharacterized protein n=1 Tax=Anguilla anguilla TaxID=7936 RepID=A0A0E9XV30_ANGAN
MITSLRYHWQEPARMLGFLFLDLRFVVMV